MTMGKWITSILAWLQIVASPLLIGIVIGFIIYYNVPGKTGLVLAVVISTTGLIIGVIWHVEFGKNGVRLNSYWKFRRRLILTNVMRKKNLIA